MKEQTTTTFKQNLKAFLILSENYLRRNFLYKNFGNTFWIYDPSLYETGSHLVDLVLFERINDELFEIYVIN